MKMQNIENKTILLLFIFTDFRNLSVWLDTIDLSYIWFRKLHYSSIASRMNSKFGKTREYLNGTGDVHGRVVQESIPITSGCSP